MRFLLGGECTLRDVVRTWCIFFFIFFLFEIHHILYIGLVTILTYIVLIFFTYWCMFFHLSLHVLFLFFLYIHVSYIMYAISYFCFTLRCRDKFCLKVFQKYRLSKSFLPYTLFLQIFSRVCVRIDFIVFNKWIWVEWFMTSVISHLLVVVLSRIAKGGDC